jgi:hypothetical protein
MKSISDLKREVAIELLLPPVSIGMLAAAFTLLPISLGTGSGVCAVLGLGSLFGFIGVGATNFLLNFDKAMERVLERFHKDNDAEQERQLAEQRARKEKELDDLDTELVRAKGKQPHLDQKALRDLRKLHAKFHDDLKDGCFPPEHVTEQFVADMDHVFETCIHRLEYSVELWDAAEAASGATEERLLKRREDVVREVVETVSHYSEMLMGVRSLGVENQDVCMSSVREVLDQNLEVARNSEREMSSFRSELKSDRRVT